MDRMIYVAMSGARQLMQRQATNNHNLANHDTVGFKAEIDAFRAMPVHGPGFPGRVYGENMRVGTDYTAGTLIHTANPLDVAIDGAGFIAVQDTDGREAYTRAGALRVSPQGVLETASGHPVIGNAGPITLSPYEKIAIAGDGTITVQPLGQAAGEVAVIDRIKLVNPDTASLSRTRHGLFKSDAAELPADAAVTLQSGSLEASNVSAIDAMVNMIELARQYETQVKLMKSAERNDQAAAHLLKRS